MAKKRKLDFSYRGSHPKDQRLLGDPGQVEERELGEYEGAVADLCLDLAEAVGKLLDASLGSRRPEIEQIIVGVSYRDEVGEGTAWKSLYANRWTSTRGLVDAIQDNLRIDTSQELLDSVHELLARLQR